MVHVSLIVCFITLMVFSGSGIAATQPITRIVFASCNNQKLPQPAWDAIQSHHHEVFIWLGDVVYADRGLLPMISLTASAEKQEATLKAFKSFPPYQKLLSQGVKVLGTWDDHDYGMNDGGNEHIYRESSQRAFLRFLDEPEGSLRFAQKGVYGNWSFGNLHIVLLDTRYHRGWDRSADVLGEEQWRWLERVLEGIEQQKKKAILLLGSSIQVLPHDKPISEKWADFPMARSRLLRLLATVSKSGIRTILLSGDVHYGEMMRMECDGAELVEATSSGLTHSCASQWKYICFFMLRLFAPQYRVGVYADRNFGSIEIDWENEAVTLAIHDVSGKVVLEEELRFSSNISNFSNSVCGSDSLQTPFWAVYPIRRLRPYLPIVLVGGIFALFFVGGYVTARKILLKRKNTVLKKKKKKS